MKVNLYNNKIILVILLLPLIEPSGISDMAIYNGGVWVAIDSIFSVLRHFSPILALIIIFHESKTYRPSRIVILIITYEAWFLLSCFINSNITGTVKTIIISTITISLICDYYMSINKQIDFFEIISLLLCFFVVLNFVTLLIFPGGMYTDDRGWRTGNFFLGNKNRFMYFFIPCLAFTAMKHYIKFGKLKTSFYLLLCVIVVSALMSNSSTAAVSAVMFLVLIIMFGKRKIPKYINIFSAFILMTLLSVLFVLFNFQIMFNSVLQALFGKDATFSSRIRIWQESLGYILSKPILGSGYKVFDMITWTATQAHNNYIDIMVVGGIVLFIVYCLIIFATEKKLRECENNCIRNVITFLIWGYYVLFLMEARRVDVMVYAVYILAYHSKSIVAQVNSMGSIRKKRMVKLGSLHFEI